MAVNLNNIPAATSLANTDKTFFETAGGAKSATFQTIKESMNGYFKKVADDYMAFDYEDLAALRADGELIAGATYLLTDYQTVYRQSRPGQVPDYADKMSVVEPLVLTAISASEFSSIAYSPTFPQDVIWYNFDNELSPDNTTVFYSSVDRIVKKFKGIIIRRIDTQKNIDYSYDWRTMLWWREGNEVLTFADLATTYNIISGNNCLNNTFGNNCLNNTFGNNCYNNTFGNNCLNNTFGNSCLNNTFGNYCSGNTFGGNCRYNTFSRYLQYADVKSGFANATVTNPAIYDQDYNHTFYIDSAGNKKCYCITGGAITDVLLTED